VVSPGYQWCHLDIIQVINILKQMEAGFRALQTILGLKFEF
jgi:hypothetical protein